MKYYYQLWCPDCRGEDYQGCFGGGTETIGPYDTPQEANKAGWNDTLDGIWEYQVVDEERKVVEVSEPPW